VERACYQLAHNLVLAMPGLGRLRRFGVVAASPENARRALETGRRAARLPRRRPRGPPPELGERARGLRGRKGWIRSRSSTTCPWSRSSPSAARRPRCSSPRGGPGALLRLDRTLRLKVLPVSLALPWILNVGDFAGHLPLPAKITIEALPPIDLREHFGPEPDVDEVYDHVTGLMQATLDALAAERRLPVLG
jgi:hypothetical protein